jgi:hypothetical protein
MATKKPAKLDLRKKDDRFESARSARRRRRRTRLVAHIVAAKVALADVRCEVVTEHSLWQVDRLPSLQTCR